MSPPITSTRPASPSAASRTRARSATAGRSNSMRSSFGRALRSGGEKGAFAAADVEEPSMAGEADRRRGRLRRRAPASATSGRCRRRSVVASGLRRVVIRSPADWRHRARIARVRSSAFAAQQRHGIAQDRRREARDARRRRRSPGLPISAAPRSSSAKRSSGRARKQLRATPRP